MNTITLGDPYDHPAPKIGVLIGGKGGVQSTLTERVEHTVAALERGDISAVRFFLRDADVIRGEITPELGFALKRVPTDCFVWATLSAGQPEKVGHEIARRYDRLVGACGGKFLFPIEPINESAETQQSRDTHLITYAAIRGVRSQPNALIVSRHFDDAFAQSLGNVPWFVDLHHYVTPHWDDYHQYRPAVSCITVLRERTSEPSSNTLRGKKWGASAFYNGDGPSKLEIYVGDTLVYTLEATEKGWASVGIEDVLAEEVEGRCTVVHQHTEKSDFWQTISVMCVDDPDAPMSRRTFRWLPDGWQADALKKFEKSVAAKIEPWVGKKRIILGECSYHDPGHGRHTLNKATLFAAAVAITAKYPIVSIHPDMPWPWEPTPFSETQRMLTMVCQGNLRRVSHEIPGLYVVASDKGVLLANVGLPVKASIPGFRPSSIEVLMPNPFADYTLDTAWTLDECFHITAPATTSRDGYRGWVPTGITLLTQGE